MRFMILVKANKDSEAGVLPDEKASPRWASSTCSSRSRRAARGEGLQASSKGARVRFSGTKRTVIDGPFAETKELIAGFWLWQVKSLAEAIEWLKRAPFEDGLRGRDSPGIRGGGFRSRARGGVQEQEERLPRAGGQEALVGSVTTSTRGRPQCRTGPGSDAS